MKTTSLLTTATADPAIIGSASAKDERPALVEYVLCGTCYDAAATTTSPDGEDMCAKCASEVTI